MKIVATEILVKTQYLDLKATEYEDTKGAKKFWICCSRPNGTKAVVIAKEVFYEVL